MIDYIRGILTVKELGTITIEANGVGYAASVSLSTYEQLPGIDAKTVVYIHYHVREDAHKLFGFFSREEREIFRQLISVSKIGPKVALNVLSGVSIHDLIQSVNHGDPSRLQKIPGVGSKTAQRLVMELRGKLGTMGAVTIKGKPITLPVSGSSAEMSGREEVFAAMIALGYNEKQVNRALDRIEPETAKDEPVEIWIRKALQVI
jgi:holliday junction DNA helicase RuvA